MTAALTAKRGPFELRDIVERYGARVGWALFASDLVGRAQALGGLNDLELRGMNVHVQLGMQRAYHWTTPAVARTLLRRQLKPSVSGMTDMAFEEGFYMLTEHAGPEPFRHSAVLRSRNDAVAVEYLVDTGREWDGGFGEWPSFFHANALPGESGAAMARRLGYDTVRFRFSPESHREDWVFATRPDQLTPLGLGAGNPLPEAGTGYNPYRTKTGRFTDKEHDKAEFASGAVSGTSEWSLPAPLGTASIPEGMVRRFHVTPVSADKIAAEGLLMKHAVGLEGPRAVYSWDNAQAAESYQGPHSVIVEYYEDPARITGGIMQTTDVHPSQIVGIHEKWHRTARYALKHNIPTSELRKVAALADSPDNDSAKAADFLERVRGARGNPYHDAQGKFTDKAHDVEGHLASGAAILRPHDASTWQNPRVVNEAVKLLRQRNVLTPDQYDALLAQYRTMGFKIAGVTEKDALRTALDSLTRSAAQGLSEDAAYEALEASWEAKGYTALRPWHARLVARMAHATAYNEGQRALLTDPRMAGILPAFRYVTMRDERVRATHAAMDGYVASRDSKVWDLWWPPNGYNCRCRIVGVPAAQWDGHDSPYPLVLGAKAMPDEGFDKGAGDFVREMAGPDRVAAVKDVNALAAKLPAGYRIPEGYQVVAVFRRALQAWRTRGGAR